MNLTEKNNQDKNHETLYRNFGMVIFCVLGVLSIYGYFLIDTSETVSHYSNTAAGDASGFRFIIFLGIVKYGILLLGLSLIFTVLGMFIKQKINKKVT
ncbi:hypothetical protein G3O08_19075 [Cryomorpha ignava]|uniref:Uncharacterized protein n=1 Tax=Cryomorpha ignava TaxID=101383 RepID=A0A7K3WV82_9FLAO|nr:hypothetical protein [Cryomorpha ignava]NEN25599.1 hypothetical protein [Cryomorpha ignava]